MHLREVWGCGSLMSHCWTIQNTVTSLGPSGPSGGLGTLQTSLLSWIGGIRENFICGNSPMFFLAPAHRRPCSTSDTCNVDLQCCSVCLTAAILALSPSSVASRRNFVASTFVKPGRRRFARDVVGPRRVKRRQPFSSAWRKTIEQSKPSRASMTQTPALCTTTLLKS